jgi:hypothetical protein
MWLSEFRNSVDAIICEFCIDSMAVEHYSLHREDGWVSVVGKMYVIKKWRR